ncbi:hypothetical protein O4220_06255 [Rhodococcus ruber]|uniref:Integral membrane protein n=1 Tax=Rhodococcus ruber TaxID=1830 RepID=A0ABT4MAX3_9NOCA|nr:hypothetical protein [Rhodococcus ruber]MCZ4518115.1 hypothetical protein [Rhodococcus ruber]
MTGIRVAWGVAAVVAVALGVGIMKWPMSEVTNCELGLTMSPAACEQGLLDHFGFALVMVLAIPVVLFTMAAVVCRPWMSWTVAIAQTIFTAVGFFSATGSTPSLLSTLGSLPGTALALLLAVVHHVLASQKKPTSVLARGFTPG